MGVRGAGGSTTELHPMDYAGHHISFIYATDQDDNIVCKHLFTPEADKAPIHKCTDPIPDRLVTTLSPVQVLSSGLMG